MCVQVQPSTVVVYRVLFFFKQKTAYEMRISDWSSDVCSSDLRGERSHHAALLEGRRPVTCAEVAALGAAGAAARLGHRSSRPKPLCGDNRRKPAAAHYGRSEEHTSELQSLMRISYAVFCLKKKNTEHQYIKNHNQLVRDA